MVSNGPNGHEQRRPQRGGNGGSHGGGGESGGGKAGGGGSESGGGRGGNSGDGRQRVTIASDFAASRDLQHAILREVERNGYNSQSAFAIKLALEEAMINAIKHGNKLDMKKRVFVEYAVSPHQVEISVEDEGPGFTRDEVPDPTLEENLTKCSGRGILLIEAYMSSISYSKGGRRLHMIKKNEADVLPRK